MSSDPFIHLHLHTQYSFLDGAIRIKDLMKKVERCKMPAVAITDHGNLFGAIEFYKAAKEAGIKPIIGCEINLQAPENRITSHKPNQRNSHLTLLASSNAGYVNLMKLISTAHLECMDDAPCLNKDALAEYSEGIICLSGGMNGEINQLIQSEDLDSARKSVGEFIDIFGRERFFLELQDHGFEVQTTCNRQLVQLSKNFDLGLVATNDVHFLNKKDHEAHDATVCIGTGSLLKDENRKRYSPEVYFKTTTEMTLLFKDTPEAITNTHRIAEMCELDIHLDATSSVKHPSFISPDGSPHEAYFRKTCFNGLRDRYGDRANKDTDIQKRLEYEIGIIEQMGFLSYFLIVWDIVKWAKENKIPVGPGRGATGGSMVAYVLGITDICPLRFGLIFERFLNPERALLPNIAIDFCQTRRPEVIEYVRRKYGDRAVSHIITFGTLGAKSVVRDVARVMAMPDSEGARIAAMIPTELGISLADARRKNSELREELDANPTLAELWKYATFSEGLTRQSGVHAAGVVIADRDLTDYVPLTRACEGEIITQYGAGAIKELGLLRLDFLRLKDLTVIHIAVEKIHQHSPFFELDTVRLDDAASFELIGRGETVGVFLLKSEGIQNLCRQFNVCCFEDIIALISLYRPGAMGLIPEFIERKTGKKEITYLHPLLEEISQETFGLFIYQEQVLCAANLLAGYTLGEANVLRRDLGRKKLPDLLKQRNTFVESCAKTSNISEKQAGNIFDMLKKTSEYAYNKSHATAYVLITYQAAFLKANYPEEFMYAWLKDRTKTLYRTNTAEILRECRRMGIKPPIKGGGCKRS